MNVKRTIAALVLSTLPACATVGQKADPGAAGTQQATSPVVEKINGVAITKAEVDRTVKTILIRNKMPIQLPATMMAKAEEMALDQLTNAELLYQEASKTEIKDLEKLTTEEFGRDKAKFGTDEAFQNALKEEKMTEAEARDIARRRVIVNRFVEDRFAAKETVTDAEAQKFYDDNVQKYFKKDERLKASHILVKVEKTATEAEKAKAKEKAEALLKRVMGGEDFAAVAKKESNCPSAERGGDLGEFGKGQMVPPFEKAAYALKTGEISKVVETQFGFHVIKLANRIPATTEKFADVKTKIVDYLKLEKVKKAVNAYVEELKGKAKIEKS